MSRNRRRRTSSFDPGRLGAAVLLTVSVIALGLSFYNPPGSSGTALQAQTLDIEELPEIEQTTRTSQLKQATGEAPLLVEDDLPLIEPIVVAEPTPVPTLVRSAAPVGALPASRVRSVSSNETARGVTAAAQSSAPLSIAIATTGGAVSAVAGDLVAELRAAGRDVKLTTLEGAGRPDVLLVLDVSATESSYAWYCEPGPGSNAVLANLLLEALPHSDEDDEVTGPDAGFSCKEVHAGRAQTTAVLLELTRSLNSDEATAAISGAVQSYLAENAAAIARNRQRAAMVWPADGPISSHFGPSHPLGIDIAQGSGNIVAALDGRVVFAGGDPCCSYGYYVVVESAGGIHTLYAHLSRIDVKAGQAVKQGQALGPVGATGYSFGIHLHFEVFVNGSRVDPMRYLP